MCYVHYFGNDFKMRKAINFGFTLSFYLNNRPQNKIKNCSVIFFCEWGSLLVISLKILGRSVSSSKFNEAFKGYLEILTLPSFVVS